MARSRFRRSTEALPPLRLTRRDDAILRDVERFGPCLVDHIRRLHFPSYKTAAERAMKLFHHGYLERRPLPADTGQPAMAHVVASRGVARLAESGIVARPLDAVVDRPLDWAVNRADVLVRLAEAGRHPGIELPIVEAAPQGAGHLPDALVVVDMPSRLFRRVLLLDIPQPDDVAGLAHRLGAWRTWASRPAAHIEQELQGHLSARGVAPTRHRARVSIALLVADDDALTAASQAALDAGCGALVYLACVPDMHRSNPLEAIWVQAKAHVHDGDDAQRTSILA